ncbi:MAG TPA: hypothetical protein VFG68_09155 [Fimbriiglobus sp.]|nr:hypothetical protein [Fimbriiglobus sp.]
MVERLRPAFVWAVWAGMTAFAGLFVAWYGGRLPVQDDFFYDKIRFNTHLPPAADLWEQLNEHRPLLPRLVTWGVARTLGPNLRTQMGVDLALLAATAAGLILSARRLRGHTTFSDAFFPLVLLSVGQHENLLWAVQVNFILPIYLQVLGLILVAEAGEQLSPGRALGVGLCAIGLSLCGMQGVATGTPLAAWLVYAGWRAARAGSDRRAASVAVALGLAVLGLVAANFVGLVRTFQPGSTDLAVARYALRMLAAGWGPVGEQIGPAEPTRWPPLLGAATFIVLAATTWRLVRYAREPRDRLAATGLLALLAGFAVLAAGIGYGRAAVSGGALVNRYVTLMAPVLCACYLSWVRFGPPRVGEAVTGGLFLAAAVFAWPNAAAGLTAARAQHAVHKYIERDIYLGVPRSFLAERYSWFLACPSPVWYEPILEGMRQRGLAPLHRMAAEPKLREVPATWRVEAFPAAGPDGWCRADDLQHVLLTVTVSAPGPTTGVRVRYSVAGEPGRVSSEAYWRLPTADGSEQPITVLHALGTGEGLERRLWLGFGVSRFHLVVRGPGAAVRIEGVTVFVAE